MGFAGFIALALTIVCAIALMACGVIAESSRIVSVIYGAKQILPILSMVLIINGIVEIGSEAGNLNKAKLWFAIRLILSAGAAVVSVFYNIISERFYEDVNVVSYILMLLYIVITSLGDYILYYLSYIHLIRGYEAVAITYGFEEDMIRRIRRSEALLKLVCLTLVITESAFFIYVSIVVGFWSTSEVKRVVVLIVVTILGTAQIVKMINYVFMMRISNQIATDMEEISR